MRTSSLCVLTVLVILSSHARADDLNCLTEKERAAAWLYAHLQADTVAAAERRDTVYESLKSREDIEAYQRRLREFFIEQIGGLPERSPLNAQTVKTIEADGYRIENVIFDSVPGHRITANFYLPDGDGPFPGVVVSSGHSRTAKTADYNQRFGIMMARYGMAALCFDPIGQGERSQILNDQGQPAFSGTTTEHFLIGVGSILVGRNTARYRIWDAMRAIDYLVSRPEIDPKKIGMTGCSGGGTLTSYVMALDDRVTCAAPACYLTTFRRLIETRGPQDSEQNIFAQIAYGMDQTDYVLMRAPKPTLISANTDDFFDIRGTWENFRQSKRLYGRLGFPERVDLVEIEGGHGVKPQNLATIAHWMQRWLLDRDEPVPAIELTVRPAKELLCTEAGQVLATPGERSVFDLNAEHAAHLKARRAEQELTDDALREQIRTLAGIAPDDKLGSPKLTKVGTIERNGYSIEKFVLETDSGVPLPTLVYQPIKTTGKVCLYLHDDGKTGATDVERRVGEGTVVIAVDLRGQGETASGGRDKLLGDWKPYYLAYLLGRSLVGMRVEDVFAVLHLAVDPKDSDILRPVELIGVGQTGIVALHAAAMRPKAFTSVTLIDTPREWGEIVGEPKPAGQLDGSIHRALEVYDLPDLVRLAGEEKVTYQPLPTEKTND